MNEPTFRLRPYSKRELAKLYFPFTKREESAVKNLGNLIRRNPGLLKELAEACYRPRDKIFTSRQVRVIVSYLGEP